MKMIDIFWCDCRLSRAAWVRATSAWRESSACPPSSAPSDWTQAQLVRVESQLLWYLGEAMGEESGELWGEAVASRTLHCKHHIILIPSSRFDLLCWSPRASRWESWSPSRPPSACPPWSCPPCWTGRAPRRTSCRQPRLVTRLAN